MTWHISIGRIEPNVTGFYWFMSIAWMLVTASRCWHGTKPAVLAWELFCFAILASNASLMTWYVYMAGQLVRWCDCPHNRIWLVNSISIRLSVQCNRVKPDLFESTRSESVGFIVRFGSVWPSPPLMTSRAQLLCMGRVLPVFWLDLDRPLAHHASIYAIP